MSVTSTSALRDPGGLPGSSERLGAAFRLHGDPVVVLHGPGVTDIFVCRDYQERALEEALWEELHAAGFQRIVYVTAHDAMYFRDAVSADEAPAESVPAASGRAGTPRMRRFGADAPQGDRMVLGAGRRVGGAGGSAPPPSVPAPGAAGATAAPATSTPAPRRRRGMSDDDLVRNLRHAMSQTARRTAVVVVRAGHVFDSMSRTTAARAFAEALGEWIWGPRTDNVCFLLFGHPQPTRVADEIRQYGAYPALAEWLEQRARGGRTFLLVGPPPPAEIERAVQRVRLLHGLAVENWSELDRLTTAMAAEPSTGNRQWLTVLKGLATAGTPLSGRGLAMAGHLTGGAPDGRTAWERLDALTGLDAVKDHVRQLADRMRLAAARPASDGPAPEAEARHLVFTGNPGTGKTTVARLIGEIYRDLGVLARGHLVAPESAELVSPNVGGTQEATNRFVNEALDGVLFIDEAYRLTEGNEFGMEAVNQLLSRMENDRDRLVVIAAGYTDEMQRFLKANPGLPSRFPASNVIHFPDYGVDDLLEILYGMLRRAGLSWEPDTETALREVVTGLHRTRDTRFGNAREMRQLAADLEGAWSVRVTAEARRAAEQTAEADAVSLTKTPAPGLGTPARPASAAELWAEPLLPRDIPARYRVHLSSAVPPIDAVLAELDGLVGLGPVRDELKALHRTLRQRQRRGARGVAAPHLMFVGPPGTGKTTVARLVGRMFHAMGLLPKPTVVETDRAGLVASYVGQTAQKTEAVIDQARGGVLFIDEAYALAEGGPQDFGPEAITTLLKRMEDLRGQLVVVAAGYPDAMRRFLAANEGLTSRFNQTIEFPDYPPDDLVQILEGMAAEVELRVDPAARPAIADWFARCRAADPRAWANARTARQLLGAMERKLNDRVAHLPDGTDLAVLSTLTAADLPR